MRRLSRGFHRGLRLREREPGMLQKSTSGGRQFDPSRAADKELGADLVFQIPDLTAQRRLRSVQPAFGRHRQAAFLRDGDEVAKLHRAAPCFPGIGETPYKVFPERARAP